MPTQCPADPPALNWFSRWVCPQCSLKRKAWVISGGVLLLLAILLALGVSFVLRRTYGELERQKSQDAARQLLRTYELELESLERSARDYAIWSQTWEEMAAVTPAYAEQNLTAAVLANLRLQAFLLFQPDGRLHEGRVRLNGTIADARPEDWEPTLRETARKTATSLQASERGLIRQGDTLLLFAALPILRDENCEPVRGTLVQVRALNAAVLARWCELTGLKVALVPALPPASQTAEPIPAVQLGTVPATFARDQAVVWLPLHTTAGQPAGALQISLGDEIHDQSISAQWWFFGMLTVLVVASGIMFVRLLHALVLARLEALHRGVARVRETTDLSTRLPVEGRDEIAQLTDEINRMLATLEGSENRRLANEREREQLNEQLQQAQKMEAIGTMAGGIAHDFNNLLSSIMCTAGIMRVDLPENHPLLEHIGRIEQAGTSASSLIRQMLAFSRAQPVKFEQVRLHTAIAEVLQLLRAGLPRTIELRFRNEAVEDTVQADVSQLQQVVMNLATNSNHAMAGKPSGVFSVTITEAQVPDARHPETAKLPPGEYVRLEVGDTGGGIPLEIQDRIFDPFFTTKPVGTGTGLGLAVVHGIVAKHQGSIGVESVVGEGTRFFIHLPRVATPKSLAAAPLKGAPPIPPCMHVLLVDDDHLVRETLVRGLKRMGHAVVGVPSGDAALKVLRDGKTPVDLLLTDQLMPGMTGLQLGEQVAGVRPGLPMVLMSGFAASLNEQTVLDKGFSALLMKPVTLDQLRLILLAIQARAQ